MKTVKVNCPRPTFRRAGFVFTKGVTDIPFDDLSDEQFGILENDKVLSIRVVGDESGPEPTEPSDPATAGHETDDLEAFPGMPKPAAEPPKPAPKTAAKKTSNKKTSTKAAAKK